MMPTVLAWSAFGTAIIFAITALVAVFAGPTLGSRGVAIVFWIGVAMLSVSILLAVTLLVTSAFSSDSSSDS